MLSQLRGFLKNELGFSMVQGMIIAGIVAGGALVTTKLMVEQKHAMKSAETRDQVEDFHNILTVLLKDKQNCRQTMVENNLLKTLGDSVDPHFLIKITGKDPGNIIASVGGTYISNNVHILSMTLKSPYEGKRDLEILYERLDESASKRTKRGMGAKHITKSIPLRIQKNAAGDFEYCYVVSDSTEDQANDTDSLNKTGEDLSKRMCLEMVSGATDPAFYWDETKSLCVPNTQCPGDKIYAGIDEQGNRICKNIKDWVNFGEILSSESAECPQDSLVSFKIDKDKKEVKVSCSPDPNDPCPGQPPTPSTQTCTTSQTCGLGVIGYNTTSTCSKRLAHVTVQGTQLTSSSAGSTICSDTFGPGFVWLDFHTGGVWSGISSAWLHDDVPTQRGFVWIYDQKANCYNSAGNLQLTFGVHAGGAGYWSGPGSPTSNDAYIGDTPCSQSRPLICYNPSWCGNSVVSGYACSNSASCTTQTAKICDKGPPVLSYQNTTTTIGDSTTIIPTLNHNGSAVSSCTITLGGALPLGLTINSSNCVISGMPSASKTATTYTVTATNASGSSTAQVTITVNLGTPAVSFNPSSVSGTVGNALSITPAVANNGAAITSCSSTPVLPSPLQLNATTCAITGTPTAAKAETEYIIKATNSVGQGPGASLKLTIN